MRTDAERIEWLEMMAHVKGGLLLHAETESTGHTGLGLGRPRRSLREAIDQAMRYTLTETVGAPR